MSIENWEDHPKFEKAVDIINNFAQSDVITEDEVDYLQGDFENTEFNKVEKRLKLMLDEVEPLYSAIKVAYSYIKDLNDNKN